MLDVYLTFSPLAFVFFLPLVFIGAFFLLNLTLAVINSTFNEAHKANSSKERKGDRGKDDGMIDEINLEGSQVFSSSG